MLDKYRVALLAASARADAPAVIRMAMPGVGVGNRPVNKIDVLSPSPVWSARHLERDG